MRNFRVRINKSYMAGGDESTVAVGNEQEAMTKALENWAENARATLSNIRMSDGRLLASATAINGFRFPGGRDYADVSARIV